VKRRRVVAYITRVRDGQTELLVFEDPKHPHIGIQVPAGRLDADEELHDVLPLVGRITLEDELKAVVLVPARVVLLEAGELPDDPHAFEARLLRDLEHEAGLGDGDDAGLVFRFRWVPVEAGLHLFGRAHPCSGASPSR
jgi:8-oxo-dGTP diphosphatase